MYVWHTKENTNRKTHKNMMGILQTLFTEVCGKGSLWSSVIHKNPY